MFRITNGSGFHIAFGNGYTVSVQFGPNNYCENRSHSLDNSGAGERGSASAEVGVWDVDGTWYRPACLGPMQDDVYGWATPEQVAGVIAEVSALPATKLDAYR